MKLLREILKKPPYDFLKNTKTDFDQNSYYDLHNSLKAHYKGINSTGAAEYQEGGSHSINRTLWHLHNNKKYSINPTDYVKKHSVDLQKTLLTQKTPHDLHVWSGTLVDPRQIKDKNDIVHHPAFLSTSLREGTAVHFAKKRGKTYGAKNGDLIHSNHILKIHIPKDHPGLYMGNHDENGFGKYEKEFILPAGTNLKHTKTETFNHEDMERNDFTRHVFHVHHMEVMPHKYKQFPIKPLKED